LSLTRFKALGENQDATSITQVFLSDFSLIKESNRYHLHSMIEEKTSADILSLFSSQKTLSKLSHLFSICSFVSQPSLSRKLKTFSEFFCLNSVLK
jgi:hypothetical protein